MTAISNIDDVPGRHMPMRRVLLIAFHYPPSESIGAQRPRGLAKYLPEFGWLPTVLTPIDARRAPSDGVVETAYLDIVSKWKRRFRLKVSESLHEQWGLAQPVPQGGTPLHTHLIRNVRSFLAYPDETKGWIPLAKKALLDLRREKHEFDAVISTAHPISCHIVGAEAKRILSCPWIADFRDLWTQNSNSATPRLLRPFEARLERKTLSHADALVTVSPYLADLLRERYRDRLIRPIANGFDPEDFPTARRVTGGPLTIVHTGQLYEGRRDPTMLLQAVAKLLRSGQMERSKVRIYFYGLREAWLVERSVQLGLEDVVMFPGPVPRAESLQAQMQAQLLLLLNWNGADSAGVLTGKVFEYLGARRPILLLGGDSGALTNLLTETRAGLHVPNLKELEKYLLQVYQRYNSQGEVPYEGIQEKVAAYSHREMARRFAELLNCIADGNRCSASLQASKLQAVTCN